METRNYSLLVVSSAAKFNAALRELLPESLDVGDLLLVLILLLLLLDSEEDDPRTILLILAACFFF